VSASKSPPTCYRLTFDSEGGSLTHAELLKHADMTDKAQLCAARRKRQRVYVAQTGLIGGASPPTRR
jgi:YidC/Oxa1 family membrane protein insertase